MEIKVDVVWREAEELRIPKINQESTFSGMAIEEEKAKNVEENFRVNLQSGEVGRGQELEVSGDT